MFTTVQKYKRALPSARWTIYRLFSCLSIDDKNLLHTLASNGDHHSLTTQLTKLWHEKHASNLPKIIKEYKIEKIIADLYSSSEELSNPADLDNVLDILRCVKHASSTTTTTTSTNNTSTSAANALYSSLLELLEGFLEHDNLDMAYLCFLEIKKENHFLDRKALHHFVDKTAQHCHISYMKEVLEYHHPTQQLLQMVVEPLIMSGSVLAFAELLDRYFFLNRKEPPSPRDLLRLLQDILKARIRRALSNARLSKSEMRGMLQMETTLKNYKQVLLDKKAFDNTNKEIFDIHDGTTATSFSSIEKASSEDEPTSSSSSPSTSVVPTTDLQLPPQGKVLPTEVLDYMIECITIFLEVPMQMTHPDLASRFISDYYSSDRKAFSLPLSTLAMYRPLYPYLSEISTPLYLDSKDVNLRGVPKPSLGEKKDSEDMVDFFVDGFDSAPISMSVPCIKMNMDDLSSKLASRKPFLRPLYASDLFPRSIAHEQMLVLAYVSEVFEPLESYDMSSMAEFGGNDWCDGVGRCESIGDTIVFNDMSSTLKTQDPPICLEYAKDIFDGISERTFVPDCFANVQKDTSSPVLEGLEEKVPH
eukprot:gene7468-8256_t